MKEKFPIGNRKKKQAIKCTFEATSETNKSWFID